MRAGVQLVKWLMNRWKQGRKSRNYFQWQDTKGTRRWCSHGHISWLFQFEALCNCFLCVCVLGSGFILLLKCRQTGASHVGRYMWVCRVCGGTTISTTLLIAVTEHHHSLAKQFFLINLKFLSQIEAVCINIVQLRLWIWMWAYRGNIQFIANRPYRTDAICNSYCSLMHMQS